MKGERAKRGDAGKGKNDNNMLKKTTFLISSVFSAVSSMKNRPPSVFLCVF